MVVLRADAVSCSEVWSLLDRIVHRIEDGAHVWDIDDPDALEGTMWLRQARRSLRELFDHAVKNGAYPIELLHTRRVIVTVNPVNEEMTPEQAVKYVTKPLYVLMENRFTDGLFLKTVLELLAPEPLRQLLKRNVQDLILPDSAGGSGELRKLVKHYASKAARERVPVRAIVFTDSDSLYPSHVSKHAEDIQDTCRSNSVPCFILRKRCIESYIPDEVLKSWVNCQANKNYHAKVGALTRLTPDQRDHVAIKNGLPQDEKLCPEERSLYASINQPDRKALSKALGNKVIEALESHKTALSADALQRRDHGRDLDYLVRMIIKEL